MAGTIGLDALHILRLVLWLCATMILNSSGNKRLQRAESSICLEVHSVSGLKDQRNEETSVTRGQSHSDAPTSEHPGTHANEDRDSMVTSTKIICMLIPSEDY